MTSEWLLKSTAAFLPQACWDECLSSQTGVIELAATDSGAVGVKMKEARERDGKGWERDGDLKRYVSCITVNVFASFTYFMLFFQ